MTQPNGKPRSASDLLPECPACGKAEYWDRVPSGWIRCCGHGGIVKKLGAYPDKAAYEFKIQLPVAFRTNWLWGPDDGRAKRAYVVYGRLYWMTSSRVDVFVPPPDGAVYAMLSGAVREFWLIEEPLPAVGKPEENPA